MRSAPGQLFVLSAPSGVGKTTLLRSVRAAWPGLRYSVSWTTRPPRPGETDGQDYTFVSREAFLAGVREGRFLEWAEVYGELYGTDGFQVREWLAGGAHVALDIDVQGARQVRVTHPACVTVFILPPSLDTLRERLTGRGTETPERLARRLAASESEIRDAAWYDYIVVNDDLSEAVSDLSAILRAHRCARAAQAPRLDPFLHPAAPAP